VQCPSCRRQTADDFAFCSSCGAALNLESTSPREERKVVTVLFADLVGFTARAETLDPEDVRAVLTRYHARLRVELERFGGTVEKFIGDAVMALFGAPVAHEDDPERAVRAALAIRDWAVEEAGDLQVRIGVNTGEALVALDARPSEGESMAAGDVVNTAARLQAGAPLNGVLVGEQTYRATAETVEYEPFDPVAAKGKTEPVPAWEAQQARSRFGVDVAQRVSAPLVGRVREVELLVSTLARVREERSPQLVTLVGVPGIGKSRLVHELMEIVDAEPDLTSWRQGRSLPYGEGVTFWALAEIVKAQAGIFESDTTEQTEEKLVGAVDRMAANGSEAQWLQRHLYALAGLAEEGSSSRQEAFAAWRRFLEALAEQRPLVLVFEDLHWADDAMLDFVDLLVERTSGVPLLVIGTARPELLERRPGWGGGKPNALTISLSPLSDDETAGLVGGLLGRASLQAAAAEAVLARAGGNPLYAEQYTRVLVERGDVEELPETVQGIIAARLDALSGDEKRLLQDASVIGKVFWLGAVEAVAGLTRWQAEELLHTLERKEFVQRSRRSTVASETEYTFRHLLIRDVAYGQIPRSARSDKHRRIAAWLESLGRGEDQSELLAHHYLQALELAEASGLDTAELSVTARQALSDAGDRAAALYAVDAAESFYDAALRLWPEGEPGRGELLLKRAIPAGRHVGGGDVDKLGVARDALLIEGDRVRAAESEMLISQALWIQGRMGLSDEHAAAALALIDGTPASRSQAWILARQATRMTMRGDRQRGVELGLQSKALAEELGWDEGMSDALNLLGSVQVTAGDRLGLESLQTAVDLAERSGSLGMVSRAYNNLAVGHQILGEPGFGFEPRLEAARAAVRLADESLIRWFEPVIADYRYRRGEWDEATAALDAFLAGVEAGAPSVLAYQGRMVRALIRLARGETQGALADADAARAAGLEVGEIQAISFTSTGSAWVFSYAGRSEQALDTIREVISVIAAGINLQFGVLNAPMLASAAVRLGLGPELVEAFRDYPQAVWAEVVRAYGDGDFVRAADLLERIGARPDEAEARMLAGGDQLERALAFYRSVGAEFFAGECERLRG
jgi:class 3 adenylate cyclase